MNSLSLDTHGFIRELVQAGMSEGQAESLAAGLQKATIQNVPASSDLAELKDRVAAVKAAITELELRLTTRTATFVGLEIAVQSLIVTMIKLWS